MIDFKTEERIAAIAAKALPYADDALSPAISQETLIYHYGRHYRGYVDTLNRLIEDTPYMTHSLESVVKGSEGAIFNNAAQAWNHEFYFEQLSSSPKARPEGDLLRAIEHSFGSFEALITNLKTHALSLFGSGWVWLVEDPMSSLIIESDSNAGTPLTRSLRPLLTLDVWEHAYYIDYRNRRADAIEEHLKMIDWAVIESRYMR